MIKKVGARYTLIGHSDNRAEGETDLILKEKVSFSIKNNLKVVFCIGENKTQKKKKRNLPNFKKTTYQSFRKKI